MSDAKRRLEEEFNKIQPESICPECGDERQEITVDHDTFWVCYSYTCDPQYHNDLYSHANAEEEDMTPEEDEGNNDNNNG